jgi:hypothetical protein
LITLSEDTGAPSAVATPEAIQGESGLGMRRKLRPFGLISAPQTALHEGFLSLADQAVASVTNFVTGVIIARSSSKEEFGLYMLGFSLILLTTDLQTSLIATPYMVYAPRLKGRAHALYAGSTLIHQVAFSLLGMLALACAAVTSRFGIGPRGLGPVLWALGAMAGLIMLREFVRRICFAGLKLRSVLAALACPSRRAIRERSVLVDWACVRHRGPRMAVAGEQVLSPAAFSIRRRPQNKLDLRQMGLCQRSCLYCER